MRILYWTELYWPHVGGIETLSLNLIPALQEKGYEIEVITSHSRTKLPDKDFHNGVHIHRFPFLTALTDGNLGQLLIAQKQLAALKGTFQPDLIHIHFSGPSSFFHWRTQQTCPTLLTLHSIPWQTGEKNKTLQNGLERSDWVSSVSAAMLSRVTPGIPDPKRTSVIYNGMVLPNLLPAPLPTDAPVILIVGRLVAWKRFNWAIELFAEVKKDFPDTNLLVIGDGPEKENLQDLTSALKLEKSVTFTGGVSQDRLFELINSASVVLAPSEDTENIPYTAVEASWMGRPVIASDVSGLPEIIMDGITGFLVPPHDKETWLNRIIYLLENPEVAQSLGDKAHQHVREKFNMENCVNEYDQLYRKIIKDHNAIG